MENKDPKRIPPKPGIAEAIHPEIGNGVSWETDQHLLLLRSPDPTKDLDNHLLEIDSTPINIPHPANVEALDTGVKQGPPEIIEPKDLVAAEKGNPPEPIEANQEENFVPPMPKKGKEKANGKKKAITQETKVEDGSAVSDQEEIADQPKVPKAGKLVRKAAKSARKQEEDEMKLMAQNLALTESTLSPYTQWLKTLKGSEYVHPYDDDFAFVQGSGPAREGISETFAELLANQGYKDQAVEMYMKLMEKYPEKSGFFAAKIEALQ